MKNSRFFSPFVLLLGLVVILSGCEIESISKDPAISDNAAINLTTQLDDCNAVIDFQPLAAGTIVSSLSSGNGVSGVVVPGTIAVYGENLDPARPDENHAMIFDTDNPTGGDTDLVIPGADYMNVLIISEDLDSSDPDDDNVPGGIFAFDFSGFATGVVDVFQFNALDTEEGGTYEAFNSDGVSIANGVIPSIADGTDQTVSVNAIGVEVFVVMLDGSGAVDNFCIYVEMEEEECFPCDGKVTELSLQYNGDTEDAHIVVTQKKDDVVVFDETVQPGEVFSFVGIDKKNTLGTEITITVNGEVNTKIHTSCSQPIGPGLSFGDFLVVAGASRNGGALCPLDPPPGGGDDCGECDGKVTRLDMSNDGPSAQILVTDKKGENVIFDEFVNTGDSFTLTGFDKKGTLGTEIVITVGNSETKIHTSCSQPIGPGLTFGDFTVIGGASRNGGELCPVDSPPGDDNGDNDCGECEGKVTRLDLTYNGATPADIIVKDKKGENEITIGTVNPGDTFTIDGASGVFDDKKGTLGTEISIHIDGSENTKIHTSCSQPVDIGLTFGDFTVIGGASREGGEFCGGSI